MVSVISIVGLRLPETEYDNDHIWDVGIDWNIYTSIADSFCCSIVVILNLSSLVAISTTWPSDWTSPLVKCSQLCIGEGLTIQWIVEIEYWRSVLLTYYYDDYTCDNRPIMNVVLSVSVGCLIAVHLRSWLVLLFVRQLVNHYLYSASKSRMCFMIYLCLTVYIPCSTL